MINNTIPSSQQPDLVQFPVAPQVRNMRALPAQAKHHFQEGIVRLQSGDAAGAVAAFSQSLEHAPEFSEGHVFLGIAHSLTYNIYPAIDHLEEAGRLDPDSFAAHYTLAQLNFKLRTPQKGYEEAKHALRCVQTLEQRRLLTQLLKEERERERNGIARPSFTKTFSTRALVFAGSALAATIIFVMAHMR
jgi:tetratricopeptide (TPR) repeat protein